MGAYAPSSFVGGVAVASVPRATAVAAEPETLVGKTLGRYRVLARLAVGGMAELWLARKSGSDGETEKVVLKTMLPRVADSGELVRMFEREGALGSRLRHPNLVHVLDCGRGPDRYFIAMEYINGLNLREMGRRFHELAEPFPQRLLLTVLIDVCRGLHAAHELSDGDGTLQFVHRDVSPENIMVTRSGATKLIDFGAALTLRVPTTSTPFVGKLRYVAPERIQGRAEDRRCDVYSLGVILYEYLTGRRPFEGAERTMISRILEGRPRPPREVCPDLLPELANVTSKSLAFNPDDRYDTAAALAADLLPLVEGPQLASSKDESRRVLRRAFDMLGTAGKENEASVISEADTKTVEMEVGALREAVRRTREEITVVSRMNPARRRPSTAVPPGITKVPGIPVASAAPPALQTPVAPSPPSLAPPVVTPAPAHPAAVDPASLFDRLERPNPPVAWFDIGRGGRGDGTDVNEEPGGQAVPDHRRTPVDEAVRRFDQGLSLLADKLYAAALEEWERACALEPENRTYQINLKRLRDRMQSSHPEAGPNPRSVHEHQE